MADGLSERLFHVVEMGAQTVHAQGAGKVLFVTARKQLDHVTEIAEPVVDGRRRQQKQGFWAHRRIKDIEHLVVARRVNAFVRLSFSARVSEVVGLVNDDHVGEGRYSLESLWKIPFPVEVGVAEDREIAEIAAHAADMRKPLPEVWVPDTLLRGFRGKQHHALAFVEHKPLDQHQPDESFSKTNSITKESAPVLPRYLQQRPIGFLLIPVDLREHLRTSIFPFGLGEFMPAEEFLQGFAVDVKRRVKLNLAGDGFNDVVGDLAGLIPVRLEPFLELRDFARALHLYVQLDVFCQSRQREVA